MSTKHLRRVLEQKEAEKEKEKAAAEGESSEDEEAVAPKPKFNKFAFLEDEDDGSDGAPESASVTRAVPTKKKNNKKKKNKGKKGAGPVEEDEDALLEKLANEASGLALVEGDAVGETLRIEELFKIDRKLFDPSMELKKALGKILNEKSEQSNSHHVHKAGLGRIARSKTSWPPVRSIGLTMLHDRDDSNGIKWFKFIHNATYEKCERLCWLAEDSFNHEFINEVLHNSFYHLNALLLLANVTRMQEDMTQSCDSIERGIYFCEHSFHPLFQVFTWQHRLDYVVYENRAFFLLLHRHLLNIVHKRCFKTALNVAKLIFGLDPQGDPLGILLIIDTIAIKAKEFGWLKNMYAAANEWKNLSLLPNFLYSLAMVRHLEGDDSEEADRMLSSAIVAHPGVVTEILNELQIQADKEVENNAYLKTAAHAREPEGLQMLVKIYVKQSAELWKVPSTLSWLEKVTRLTVKDQSLQKEMESWREKRQRVFVGSPPNMRRLAMQLGLEQEGASVTDPVPPANGIQRYSREAPQEEYADGFLSGFLHSLYPDFNGTEHLGDAVHRMLSDLLGGGRGGAEGADDPDQPAGAAPPQQE